MIPAKIVGSEGNSAKVNNNGELLVSGGAYDLAQFIELDLVNTAYNFFKPLGRQQFVITGFLVYGDKQVSPTTNSTVVIYEASQEDTIVVDRVLVQFEVGQNQSIPFPNIRILCNAGTYINGKCDDDDVHMTIFGHYVNQQIPSETR
jgi:hypothetical protein